MKHLSQMPWLTIDGPHGKCAACGGLSQFVFMREFGSRGQAMHFTYWRWRKGFKRAHGACGERIASAVLGSEDDGQR